MDFDDVQPPELPEVYLDRPWWASITHIFAPKSLCLRRESDRRHRYVKDFVGSRGETVVRFSTLGEQVDMYKITDGRVTVQQNPLTTVYKWKSAQGYLGIAPIPFEEKIHYPAFIGIESEESDTFYIISAEDYEQFVGRWCVVINRKGVQWLLGGDRPVTLEQAFYRHLVFFAQLQEQRKKIESQLARYYPEPLPFL